MIRGGPDIVSDGLILYLDAANKASYPGDGSIFYDLSPRKINASIGPAIASSEGTFLQNPSTNLGFYIYPDISSYQLWTVSVAMKTTLYDDMTARSILIFYPAEGTNKESAFYFNRSLFHVINIIKFDANNDIYVGGQFGGYQDVSSSYIVKMDPSGYIINTFKGAWTPTNAMSVAGIDFDASRNLYLYGTNLGNMGLVRVNPCTGEVISTVPSAYSSTSVGGGNMVIDQSTNSMWITGFYAARYQNVSAYYITKMTLDGSYSKDASFDTSTGFNNSEQYALLLDSSKNLYVGGDFTRYQNVSMGRIVKIDGITGQIDYSFNCSTGFNAGVYTIAQQADKKILVGGAFTSYNGSTGKGYIVRLNTDGTIDASFNSGIGFSYYVRDIVVQDDEKILIVGDFANYQGVARGYIVRLNSDGTFDTGFNSGTGFNNYTDRVKVQPDGKIIVLSDTTSTTSYNGTSFSGGILRLNTDGTLDTSFGSGSGFNMGIYRDNNYKYISGNTADYSYGDFSGQEGARLLYSDFSRFWNNQWKFLTITFDASRYLRYYVNGQLKTIDPVNASDNLRIRYFYTYNYLSSLAIYDRPLSATEVKQNYNSFKSRFAL